MAFGRRLFLSTLLAAGTWTFTRQNQLDQRSDSATSLAVANAAQVTQGITSDVPEPKDLLDNATPSANSVAAVALLRLSAITGSDRYEEHALEILRLLGPLAAEHPSAFAHLLGAADLATTGITEIAVSGDRPDLVDAVRTRYLPNAVLAWGERFASPLWEGRAEAGAAGRAYVCHRFVCRAPVDAVDALVAELTA